MIFTKAQRPPVKKCELNFYLCAVWIQSRFTSYVVSWSTQSRVDSPSLLRPSTCFVSEPSGHTGTFLLYPSFSYRHPGDDASVTPPGCTRDRVVGGRSQSPSTTSSASTRFPSRSPGGVGVTGDGTATREKGVERCRAEGSHRHGRQCRPGSSLSASTDTPGATRVETLPAPRPTSLSRTFSPRRKGRLRDPVK